MKNSPPGIFCQILFWLFYDCKYFDDESADDQYRSECYPSETVDLVVVENIGIGTFAASH